MERRYFIRTASMAALAVSLGACYRNQKTHVLTLSWDDGFKKSFHKIAEIHERYGLKACLNIIASAHKWEETPNDYHSDPVGDYNDWNKLKARGHEIMPHTWKHTNLTEVSFEEAMGLIDKCIDYFIENLEGFDPSTAVYNFAYNASTPELEDYALSRVRAVRTGGWDILGERQENPFPGNGGPLRLGCWSYGPENADNWVQTEIDKFLGNPAGGWLILNLHGLDDEGWGPVSSNYLDKLLKKLVEIDFLDTIPAGKALEKYAF